MASIQILVVEDEETIQELISYHLKKEGKVGCFLRAKPAKKHPTPLLFEMILQDFKITAERGFTVYLP